MKILLIAPFFYENSTLGSVKYLLKFCDVLSDDNEVTVFTTKSKKISYSKWGSAIWNEDIGAAEEKMGKIMVKRFKTKGANVFSLAPKILENFSDWFYRNKLGPNSKQLESALKKNYKNYDIIILSYFPFKIVYSCAKILKKRGKKFLLLPFYHHNDSCHQKEFLKKILKWSSGILELNEFSAKLFRKLYKKDVFNIKGYIPAPSPCSKEKINEFKTKNNLVNKFIVLTVGRKEPSKNYQAVINALSRIKDSDVVLLLVGEDIDKKKLPSEKIIYLSNANDETVSLAYNSSDVFVNMSLNESFGQVFLEAWSFSLPVIANKNCDAVKSLIKKDGFLCGDAQCLADKIVFLKNNPLFKKFMGIAGKKRLKKEFGRNDYKKNLAIALDNLKKEKRFIILGHPRSGSTVLARALEVHPKIKISYEPFNENNKEMKKKLKNLKEDERSLDEFLSDIFINNFNGIKTLTESKLSFDLNKHLLLAPNRKVILLSRKNLLEAALSWEISAKTDYWYVWPDKVEKTRAAIIKNKFAPFSLEEIKYKMDLAKNKMETYKNLLLENKADFLEIFYEDIFNEKISGEEQLEKINELLNFLGYEKITDKLLAKSVKNIVSYKNKLNNEETYKVIPNICEIKEKLSCF